MLYSILKTLLMPPGILILMLLAAFLMVRGVLGRMVLFAVIVMLTLMSLPVVGTHLMEPLEPYPALGTETTPIPSEAQAIVVLSAGRWTDAEEYGGDTVDELTLRRLRYAVRLYRTTGLPLYVSGGSPPHEDPPIAQLMAQVLQDEYGVAVAAVESRSRTTWENAAYTAALLQRDGRSTILLVSDAWHLPRAVDAFAATGVEVIPAPTGFIHHPSGEDTMTYRDWLPSARGFMVSYYALHEHLGRVWYQLREWAQGPPQVLERPA